jgi:HEPN domain-containing protein
MQPAPERWWAYAERDLDTARALLGAGRWEAVSFFAQQAVEKALKALVVLASGELPPRVHDLVRPAELTGVPEEFWPELDDLSRAYALTRYPDAIPGDVGDYGIDPVVAERHLHTAERALQWVEQRLSTGS